VFTIGEFSKITGLSVKTLRFYHEKGLLAPAAIDPASGYRLYDERNIDRALAIKALRSLELSLDEIAEILKVSSEDEDVLVYLDRHRDSLAERIRRLRGAAERIDEVLRQQRDSRDRRTDAGGRAAVEERDLDDVLVAGVRMVGQYRDLGKGIGTLARRLGGNIAGKPFCLYYDGEYLEEGATFEPCFPIRREARIDGVDVRRLAGGRCVALTHRGPYEQLGATYARILRYAKQRGYELKLPTREVYLKAPGMIFRGNPQKYLTEIQMLIAGR